MPSTPSLLNKVIIDFPHLTFESGDRFSWSPSRQTVSYDESDLDNVALFLHELAHGVLEHRRYSKDVELLAMENQAWEKALEIAKNYTITIEDETIQDHLDTYREWLHARSTCPQCEATGYQQGHQLYRCVACNHEWRVNEARICALRRYTVT